MKWGVINLKELTDEIVQKSMDSYNSIWWVILIILLFFAITMICIIVSLAVKGTIIGQEKLIIHNITGLLVASAICVLLSVGCVFMIKSNTESRTDWRIEIKNITNLDHHTEYENTSDVSYEVYEAKVSKDSRKIRISENEYNSLNEGDEVYVLMAGNSLEIDIWSTKDYIYTGAKLIN